MVYLFLLLCIGYLKCVWAYKTFRGLPAAELRRRARAGDERAAHIYKVAAYEHSFDLFIWLWLKGIGIAIAIWAVRTSWWAGALALIALVLVYLLWPMRTSGWQWQLAAFTGPYYAKVLSWLNPALAPIARVLPSALFTKSTGAIYEKEDLLELFKNQSRRRDNRIPEPDLAAATAALNFSERKVKELMTPRKKLRLVSEDETIGPMLMDELHKTGQKLFAVVRGPLKAKPPHVVAQLNLREVLKHLESGGKVKDIASAGISYIHEQATLADALEAMRKSGHSFLLVVNNFEDIVGGISLHEILLKLLPEPGEFNDYDDLKSVAGQFKKAEPDHHEPIVR